MNTLLCIDVFLFLLNMHFIHCEGHQDDTRKLRKTFTNEFIFKLKNEIFSPVVKQKAEELGFVFQSQMFTIFLCFTRDDLPLLSEEPYNESKLAEAREHLSEYVESIDQDYERSWMSDAEAKKYAEIQKYIDSHIDNGGGQKKPHTDVHDTIMPEYAELNDSPDYDVPPTCEKGEINVAFIDQGFELGHPNLVGSTDASLSYNFITKGNKVLPDIYEVDMKHSYPEQYADLSHGTMSMGRVGAEASNGCDAGVAPNVNLVGLKAFRFNTGIQDTREAEALSYRHDDIDVFACCYGATDNIGFSGPRSLTVNALEYGATKSRDCRGVIYIYPSGNGRHDNCNADGYANSVDTITIATVNRKGRLKHNGEICSAALAAAVGKGFNTTSLNNLCSDEFEGSSAACAVAAGFVGELRVVRPCLSKRDIEYIMVSTAIPGNGTGWRTNGAGLMFNDYMGFGHLDLEEMKTAAKKWMFLPQRHVCEIYPTKKTFETVAGTHWRLQTEINSDACRGKHEVNYLEHVQVLIEFDCDQLSQVAIQLISPAKTVSNILTKINFTSNDEHINRNLSWTFMSVNFWNEAAEGVWTVEIIVDDTTTDVECKYRVNKLTLYGTDEDPYSGTNKPLTCKDSNGTIDSTPVQSTKEHFVLILIGIVVGLLCIGVVGIVFKVKRDKICERRIHAIGMRYQNVNLSDDEPIEKEYNNLQKLC